MCVCFFCLSNNVACPMRLDSVQFLPDMAEGGEGVGETMDDRGADAGEVADQGLRAIRRAAMRFCG